MLCFFFFLQIILTLSSWSQSTIISEDIDFNNKFSVSHDDDNWYLIYLNNNNLTKLVSNDDGLSWTKSLIYINGFPANITVSTISYPFLFINGSEQILSLTINKNLYYGYILILRSKDHGITWDFQTKFTETYPEHSTITTNNNKYIISWSNTYGNISMVISSNHGETWTPASIYGQYHSHNQDLIYLNNVLYMFYANEGSLVTPGFQAVETFDYTYDGVSWEGPTIISNLTYMPYMSTVFATDNNITISILSEGNYIISQNMGLSWISFPSIFSRYYHYADYNDGTWICISGSYTITSATSQNDCESWTTDFLFTSTTSSNNFYVGHRSKKGFLGIFTKNNNIYCSFYTLPQKTIIIYGMNCTSGGCTVDSVVYLSGNIKIDSNISVLEHGEMIIGNGDIIIEGNLYLSNNSMIILDSITSPVKTGCLYSAGTLNIINSTGNLFNSYCNMTRDKFSKVIFDGKNDPCRKLTYGKNTIKVTFDTSCDGNNNNIFFNVIAFIVVTLISVVIFIVGFTFLKKILFPFRAKKKYVKHPYGSGSIPP